MEENNKKCPECGSSEIREGVLETHIQPKGAIFAASRVTAKVCRECGLVFEMRAVDPHIFK